MATILIVDDEPAVRGMISEILIGAGHQVAEAGNGNEALDKCRAIVFDLVLMDIIMPEKEGLETIRELRQIIPRQRIIAISGGGRGMDSAFSIQLAALLGADYTLEKPFRRAELLALVDAALGPEPTLQ